MKILRSALFLPIFILTTQAYRGEEAKGLSGDLPAVCKTATSQKHAPRRNVIKMPAQFLFVMISPLKPLSRANFGRGAEVRVPSSISQAFLRTSSAGFFHTSNPAPAVCHADAAPLLLCFLIGVIFRETGKPLVSIAFLLKGLIQ